MPKDQAYLEVEQKIQQALKSDATELPNRHPFKSVCPLQSPLANPFIRSLSVENKGGHHAP
ncbi:MAG: hypothetical protein HYZ22_07245 [Chloroflexi bacterium]|nr:hypothetical protein [Chloroflexota bacterium]